MIKSKKNLWQMARIRHLLMLLLSFGILFTSVNAFAATDTLRKEPPPHPKPKSLKEIWKKINPFKKHKDSSGTKGSADKRDEGKPPVPEPVPPPKPSPAITPKPAPKHKTAAKKKTKAKAPDAGTKKTSTTRPLI